LSGWCKVVAFVLYKSAPSGFAALAAGCAGKSEVALKKEGNQLMTTIDELCSEMERIYVPRLSFRGRLCMVEAATLETSSPSIEWLAKPLIEQLEQHSL
jgi:hypothetical protein